MLRSGLLVTTFALFLAGDSDAASHFGTFGDYRSRSAGALRAEPPATFGGMDSVLFQGPFTPTLQDTARIPELPFVSLAPDHSLHLSYRARVDDSGGRWAYRYTVSPDAGFRWTGSVWSVQDGVNRTLNGHAFILLNEEVQGVGWAVTDSMFSAQVRFTPLDEMGRPGGSSLRVDDGVDVSDHSKVSLAASDDALLCVWLTVRLEGGRLVSFSRSFNRGRTWEQPTQHLDVRPANSYYGPAVVGANDGFYVFVYDLDQNNLVVQSADEAASGWVLVGSPVTSDLLRPVDPTIAVLSDGTIGAAFAASPSPTGPPLAVWFSTSVDGGVTWTQPVEVSRVAPEGNHYEPHLVSDPSGGWHLAWVRNTPWQLDIDAYYSRLPAGETEWSTPTRVNTEPSTVDVVSPSTLGIAADDEGYAYIAWGYTPDGFNSVDIHVATTRPGPFDLWEGTEWRRLTAVPNPTRSSVTVDIPSPTPGIARVVIYDMNGRRVRIWKDLALQRGLRPLLWDGRLATGDPAPPGVYVWDVRISSAAQNGVRIQAKSVLLQ